MQEIRRFLITVTLIALASLCFQFPSIPSTVSGQNKIERLEFAPFETNGFNGQKVTAERVRFKVPENRSKPDSKMIELAVFRFKSPNPNPAPPLVYLAGGPGGAATSEAYIFSRLLAQLQETRDIVLMDQRGTGQSRPLVAWPLPDSLPTDAFSSLEKMQQYIREGTTQAIESFRDRGIDLTGYSSVESADDLNDLRIALGADKISLFGFSYGTHLALATIRRHAAHLDSVVLVGTEGPNHTLKLPSTYDAQLRKLSDLAAQDPDVGEKVPDMVSLLKRVLAKLEKQPAVVRVRDYRKNSTVDVPVGKFGLQLIIRFDVGDRNDFPEFPALFYTIDKSDYSLLSKYVEKRYNQLGRGVSGMSAMIDLYSGATADRLDRIRKETPTSILGDVINLPEMFVADLWGNPDLGDEYRSPLITNTRTLFISGTLDSNTPPYQAEEVRWGFSNSAHIIVEYAGHEQTLPNPEVEPAVIDFLNGKEVTQTRFTLGKPKFKPIPVVK